MPEQSELADPPGERFPAVPQDIANFLSRGVADQQLRCVIRLAGKVDVGRLERAARLALDVEPVLGCRFVADARRPYWERRPDLDAIPICGLVEAGNLEAALADFLAEPLDPSRDPLTVVRVLRGGNADTFAVKVSHVVSDVGGLKDYLALLTSLYRQLGTESGSRPTRPDASRGQENVLRALPQEELRRLAAQMGGGQPAWGFPGTGDDRSGLAIAARRVDPGRLDALREAGRERGATVNDLFLAALFRALVAVLRPLEHATLAIQTTVDLRRYLPEGRAAAICNLSGIIYPTMPCEEAASLDTAIAAVVKSTRALKASYPGLGVAAYLEGAFRADFQDVLRGLRARGGGAATGRAHPMLTNFGVLPEDCVDFGEPAAVDAVVYGPAVYPPGFALGLSTFRGALTYAVAYPPRAVDGQLVERVLDLIAKDLAAVQA